MEKGWKKLIFKLSFHLQGNWKAEGVGGVDSAQDVLSPQTQQISAGAEKGKNGLVFLVQTVIVCASMWMWMCVSMSICVSCQAQTEPCQGSRRSLWELCFTPSNCVRAY